jgi:hypothetical protein
VPPGLIALEEAIGRGFSRDRLRDLVRSGEVRAFRGRFSRRVYLREEDIARASDRLRPPAPVPPPLPAVPEGESLVRIFAPGPDGTLHLQVARAATAEEARPRAVRPPTPASRPAAKPGIEPALPASILLILVAMIVAIRVPTRPSSVLGQVFGLGAALLLVASYVYPVRKHLRWPARWKSSAVLKFHTTATIAGTALAVLHGGLHYGPNVATAASAIMLVLVASGVFGNYLYVHAIHLPDKVTEASRRVSAALLRIPQVSGLRPTLTPEDLDRAARAAPAASPSASSRRTTTSVRIAPGATRFARALQLWRLVHGTVSYFFLVVLAAHVAVALCYRGNVLWSFVVDSLRRR